MTRNHYFLKEILSEPEMELFLRLRYSEFCNSPASAFVVKNHREIDMNFYDRNSLHYGIYKQENQKTSPVGYFRIVLEEPTIAEEWIKNISGRAGLMNMIEQESSSAFPCLGVYPHTNLEQEFYKKEISSERTGEVSRFFIVPAERSVKLSLQIIRSSFAIALLYIKHAVVGCFYEHSKAYVRFGFKQCTGSSTFSFKSSGQLKEGVILYCSADYLSGDLHTKFKTMQWELLLSKRLSF